MQLSVRSKVTIVGTILQTLVVVLGHLMPSLQDRGLFPFGWSAIGALVGFRFARKTAGAPMGITLSGGAIASGIGGMLGALVSHLLGDVSFNTIAIAGGSTAMAGLVAAFLGWLTSRGKGRPAG